MADSWPLRIFRNTDRGGFTVLRWQCAAKMRLMGRKLARRLRSEGRGRGDPDDSEALAIGASAAAASVAVGAGSFARTCPTHRTPATTSIPRGRISHP